MKRFLAFVAAVVAGTSSLQREREGPDCKNLPCAIQTPAATPPEHPHPLHERPTYEVRGDRVLINTSPQVSFARDSEGLKEWLRDNGYPPLAS
jgi:hypothetical protein